MNDTRVSAGLIPPSIADERGKAFGRLMERAVSDPDFKKLLFERIDSLDADLLPFLIREFSIEEFVEPGMSNRVIRRLLKLSYELHAQKGFIHGVRRGLYMLGMRVVWKQWFQNQPQTAPGTHTATVFVNETIFAEQGELIDERVQRAAQRMIAGMKRWSQDVTFQLGVAVRSDAGMATAMSCAGVVQLTGQTDVSTEFSGCAGAATAASTAMVLTAKASLSPLVAAGASLLAASRARAIQIISVNVEVVPT